MVSPSTQGPIIWSVELEAAGGVGAERSFHGLRNLSCLLRVAKSCSRRVISLCSISWGSSRGLKCKVTTKRIMRDEGSLGEEKVILPYKNRSIVEYLEVVYIFPRLYIRWKRYIYVIHINKWRVLSCRALTMVCDICSYTFWVLSIVYVEIKVFCFMTP